MSVQPEPGDLSRALAGVDASRRVGWAKAYSSQEIAVKCVVAMLLVNASLRDGKPDEARAYAAGTLRRLVEEPQARTIISNARADLDAVWEWIVGTAPGAPPPPEAGSAPPTT